MLQKKRKSLEGFKQKTININVVIKYFDLKKLQKQYRKKIKIKTSCEAYNYELYGKPTIAIWDLTHSYIANLSSDTVEEFLEHRPIQLKWWLKLVAWESRVLWILSGASIVVYLFNYMLSFATLTFSGHLGSLELASASIASVGIQGLAYGIMV
jgi:hypothetical protein